MNQRNARRGFTLIELLVVILIIGILATVAVPQYQKAVFKSRAATVLPILASIRNAQEAYYLANGDYAASVEELDIGTSCTGVEGRPDAVVCGKDWVISILSSVPSDGWENKAGAYFCPNKAVEDPVACIQGTNREFYYNAWYRKGPFPNTITCHGQTDLGKSICHGAMTTL